MSWLSDAWSLVRGRVATKRPPRGAPPWAFSSPAGAPLVGGWTDSRIEQVRHFKHWVYVAVDLIAKQVAQAFPNVSVARDASRPDALGSPERWLQPHARSRALVPLQTHEELEPVANDHPLVRLLRDANSHDTGFDLWYETVVHMQLTGNAYWWAPQNRANLPHELWVIPSHWVWPLPGRSQLVDAYQIRPVEGLYTGMTVPAEDVVHFRFKSPYSKLDGYSPQTAGAAWIDAAESVDRTRWFSFKNGPMPQLKVEFEEMNPSPELLDRIEARMQARYAGEHNTSRPMLVPKGARVEPLWISPKEMDFGKSFDQMRDAVLALFGVPATAAGINKNMTYGSVLASQAWFCKATINPLLSQLGQAITERVAQRYDPKLRVWWADQTPDDPNMREKELLTDILAGAVSTNEIRALRGRKPAPGGDELVKSPNDSGDGGRGGDREDRALRRAVLRSALLR